MEQNERGILLTQDLYAKTAEVYNNNPLEFYTWVIYYMDMLLTDYNQYYKMMNSVVLNEKHSHQSKIFVHAFDNLLKVFAIFYKLRALYTSLKTDNIKPYTMYNWQNNLIEKLFKYYNFNGDTLIPANYDLVFKERINGFVENYALIDTMKRNVDKIVKVVKEKLTKIEPGKHVLVFVTLVFLELDGSNFFEERHANIMVFSHNEVYFIEPNYLGDKEWSPTKIEEKMLSSMKKFVTTFFPEHKALGYNENMQCIKSPNLFNMCSPMSMLNYIFRGDELTFEEYQFFLKDFIEDEFKDFDLFHTLMEKEQQRAHSIKPKNNLHLFDVELEQLDYEDFPERTQDTTLSQGDNTFNPDYLDDDMSEYRQKEIPQKAQVKLVDFFKGKENTKFGNTKLGLLKKEIKYLKSL
jgi:hypothetical protein